MTANQMGEQIMLRLNAVDAFNAFDYEDVELSGFLNLAQDLYIEQNLDRLLNPKRTGFEETEARGQALSELVKTGSCTLSSSQEGILTNGYLFDLPADFRLCVLEEVFVDKKGCSNQNIQADVIVVSRDEYNKHRKNYYKIPYCNSFEAKVWRMYNNRLVSNYIEGQGTVKRHQLITDGTFNISSYKINYIQNFPLIVVNNSDTSLMRNSILDESTHSKIVELAVSLIDSSNKEERPNPLPLNINN